LIGAETGIRSAQPMSLLGQTLPSHSALVRINVCFSPQATKSSTSRERRKGPKAAVSQARSITCLGVDDKFELGR
jgi:hypothetical protein